jgi:hypothetical protein
MFTGSYDGKICVWDCSGITADTIFGNIQHNDDKDDEKANEDSDNVQTALTKLDSYIRSFN